MGGYIVTQTNLKDIPDAKYKTWQELERDYPLLRQEGDYLRRILSC
jgi:hypothetical protein